MKAGKSFEVVSCQLWSVLNCRTMLLSFIRGEGGIKVNELESLRPGFLKIFETASIFLLKVGNCLTSLPINFMNVF